MTNLAQHKISRFSNFPPYLLINEENQNEYYCTTYMYVFLCTTSKVTHEVGDSNKDINKPVKQT